jgi:hypothetical protein
MTPSLNQSTQINSIGDATIKAEDSQRQRHHDIITMSRGNSSPPPTLTSEDILSLTQVRRGIYWSAAKGFLVGASSGYLMHRMAIFANQSKVVSLTLNRNTAFASVMFGSALGSFLMATMEGKNNVHKLHPIFDRGSTKPLHEDDEDHFRSYSQRLRAMEDQQGGVDPETADRLELERNRIMRRASLSRSIKAGHGLNDSHGGQWVQDEFRKQ